MRQNPRLCKYPHKHSDVGLKVNTDYILYNWVCDE